MGSCWWLLSWAYTWYAATGARCSINRPRLNPYLRFGIIEDLDTVRHISLGSFWGVRVSVTPLTWLSPLVFFGLGVALNMARPGSDLGDIFYKAVVFVMGVEISTLVHALGHILGGKLVGSAMDELLLTATRGVNIYRGDQNACPGVVHVGRAAGGPALNGIVAWVSLLALRSANSVGLPSDLLAAVASTSLFMSWGALLPLPSVDGQVIWREVFRIIVRGWRGFNG